MIFWPRSHSRRSSMKWLLLLMILATVASEEFKLIPVKSSSCDLALHDREEVEVNENYGDDDDSPTWERPEPHHEAGFKNCSDIDSIREGQYCECDSDDPNCDSSIDNCEFLFPYESNAEPATFDIYKKVSFAQCKCSPDQTTLNTNGNSTSSRGRRRGLNSFRRRRSVALYEYCRQETTEAACNANNYLDSIQCRWDCRGGIDGYTYVGPGNCRRSDWSQDVAPNNPSPCNSDAECEIGTLEDCANKCNADNECDAFDWEAADRECDLFIDGPYTNIVGESKPRECYAKQRDTKKLDVKWVAMDDWTRCDVDFNTCVHGAENATGIQYQHVYCATNATIVESRENDSYDPYVIYPDEECVLAFDQSEFPKPNAERTCTGPCPTDLNKCTGTWTDWTTCNRCCEGEQRRFFTMEEFNVNGVSGDRCEVDLHGLSQNVTCNLNEETCKDTFMFEWECEEFDRCDVDYNQCVKTPDMHIHGQKHRSCKCMQQITNATSINHFLVTVEDEFCPCEKPVETEACTFECPSEEVLKNYDGSSLVWLFMYSGWQYLKAMC